MQRTLLLLVTCLVGAALLPGCIKKSRVQPPQAAIVAGVAAEKPAPSRGLAWQVKGWGRDQNEAEADAVQRATDLLTAFLHQLKPPLTVTPSPAYVRKHLIQGIAQRRQEDDQDIDKVKIQCWSLTLAVTPEDYTELVRHDRQARIEQERSGRMLLTALVLAGVLILLVAVIGYIRLKEWACCTRRVRSPRENLRAAKAKVLAVACVLIVAVIGLWFLTTSSAKSSKLEAPPLMSPPTK